MRVRDLLPGLSAADFDRLQAEIDNLQPLVNRCAEMYQQFVAASRHVALAIQPYVNEYAEWAQRNQPLIEQLQRHQAVVAEYQPALAQHRLMQEMITNSSAAMAARIELPPREMPSTEPVAALPRIDFAAFVPPNPWEEIEALRDDVDALISMQPTIVVPAKVVEIVTQGESTTVIFPHECPSCKAATLRLARYGETLQAECDKCGAKYRKLQRPDGTPWWRRE